jgi:regulator of RNase E activity RraA
MDLAQVLKLSEIDTPTVANGLGRLRVRDATTGYTGPDIRALTPELGPRFGMAVTARFDSTTPGSEPFPWEFTQWLSEIRKIAHEETGQVIPIIAVIESVGFRPRHAVIIGDFMATELHLAGVSGVVTNGSIRDIAGVRSVPMACWGAGLTPMHGEMRWLDRNTPVVVDGMTVRPGDFIHADENGAVVIPSIVADQVYAEATAVQREEAALFAELRTPRDSAS